MELSQTAQKISEKFAAAGHRIDPSEIESRLKRFDEFGVPRPEAERSIVSEYTRQFGIGEDKGPGQEKTVSGETNDIASVQPGDWVNLAGMVTVLFPQRSPSIAQSGILADRTGTIRFTIWAKSKAPTVKMGEWYRFESAVVDEFKGQLSFKVHSGTTITAISPGEIPTHDEIRGIDDAGKGIISIEGKVVSLSDHVTESIMQSGVIADGTGAVRFMIRNGEGIEALELNSWYRVERGVADLYRGAVNIQIGAGSLITRIEDDRCLRPAITPIIEAKPGVICIRAKMIQEWENNHERMLQTGILGDESGTIKFVIWKDNNMGKILPDTVYNIYYGNVDEFHDRLSVNLNGAAYIAEEGATIDFSMGEKTITGALVQVSPGSGLIRRCPVDGCGRILSRNNNLCQVHDMQINYSHDLRIKGWIDDGKKTWDMILSKDGVEQILGITLEKAIEMADNDPLGSEAVYYHMCDKILGRYVSCTGRIIDNRLISHSCSLVQSDSEKLAALINRAGGNGHE